MDHRYCCDHYGLLSVHIKISRSGLAFRAGCLIVVLGIWSGLGGVIEAKILHRGIRIRKFMAMRHAHRAFSADKEEMEKQLQQIQDKYNERLEESKHALGISVGVIEASLLITGTLLWGFGDLLKYI